MVGAGWIGAELATTAALRGCQVTVVEAASAPLAGALGAEVGSRTMPWYAAAGVELRLGQPVESVEPGGLVLPGGGWLAADEIVTAVGVRPEVSWLAGSGVQLENGVAVDEGLRSSVPGVYAAGDCAAFTSRRYRCRLRVEHWDSALHAPGVVAANILGGERGVRPGALLLVGAVRPDGAVRRAAHRRGPAGVARRPGRPGLVGVLAGRGPA